tara:strand:- start:2151 stop:3272 length:1122 start_codon:yes stop_codon:yes gene_type:complete
MINSRRYFPLGKAYGQAFCNREEETKKLIGNIQSGKHTFIVAPRRYGKSSLCEKAFQNCELENSTVDFHLAVTEKDVERLILKGVTELIGKSISKVDKLTSIIKITVKSLNPKFNITTGPLTLELEASSQSSPAENISEALLLLDRLLSEKDKQAVILFDEFQEVGVVAKGKGVEGAIRHSAQEMENLSIVFSGSNPHLIRNMFENERRPLYKLCKKITLNRITVDHYQKHLNKAANSLWGQNLSNESFNTIMDLTERHPYYVNFLCDEIWSESAKSPNINDVNTAWETIVGSEKSDLIKDFLNLSDNQRKLLIFMANYDSSEIFSNQSSIEMGIPSGSINRVVSTLIEKDFIEHNGSQYSLVVPAYNTLLKK